MPKAPTFILVLLVVAAVALAGDDLPPGYAVVSGIDARGPTRLTPDGKAVIGLARDADTRIFTYRIVSADGKDSRKLFDSTVDWNDLFTGAFGQGIVSPDGKRLLAITTDNGKGTREGGRPRMVIVRIDPAEGGQKPIELPCQKGATASAVFTDANTVWYADMAPPRSGQFNCVISRYDLTTGKAETMFDLGPAMCLGLTVSPDGKRLGACVAMGPPRKPSMHLWVCDLARGKWQASASVLLDDYLYDGGPWVVWGDDGKSLYANGKPMSDDGAMPSKTPFSILRFTPGDGDFINETGKGTVAFLQQDRSLAITAADKGGVLWATDKKAVYRVDAPKDQGEAQAGPLLLLDAQGPARLYRDLSKRAVMTGPAGPLPAYKAK